MRYQDQVVTRRLYQGRHTVARIPSGFAGKAPQEGLQEEELGYGAFRAALPKASVEADARSGAMCGDNAHHVAVAKGMKELNELLQAPHVA